MEPAPPSSRYIEPKISLMWLIGTASTICALLATGIWNLANANSNMAQIARTVGRLEIQLEARDARLEKMSLEISTNRAMNEVQNARISNIEEQLRALKAFTGVKP